MAKEKAKELAYCQECHKKMTIGKTRDKKRFLAGEAMSGLTRENMKFKQGKCSGCGKKGELIFY